MMAGSTPVSASKSLRAPPSPEPISWISSTTSAEIVAASLPKILDHIDGNKLNNKIENLRECDYVTNGYNRKLGINNTSGHKNVAWNKTIKKWRVTLMVKKKFKDFGYFEVQIIKLLLITFI